MANPRTCQHGQSHSRYLQVDADTGLAGSAIAVGTFTFDASSSTHTVSDAGVRANSQVFMFPTNGTAGMQQNNQSVYVDTIAAGSFVANMSATAAGVPAAQSSWGYIAVSES